MRIEFPKPRLEYTLIYTAISSYLELLDLVTDFYLFPDCGCEECESIHYDAELPHLLATNVHHFIG